MGNNTYLHCVFCKSDRLRLDQWNDSSVNETATSLTCENCGISVTMRFHFSEIDECGEAKCNIKKYVSDHNSKHHKLEDKLKALEDKVSVNKLEKETLMNVIHSLQNNPGPYNDPNEKEEDE